MSAVTHAQFEGNLQMKMKTYEGEKSQVASATMHVKQDLLAMDTEGEEGGKIIFRGDKQVLWIVNDEQQMYLELSLKDKTTKKEQPQAERSKSNVKKTGRTQTILGYECEEWLAEDGNEVTTMWGTTKLGNIYQGIVKAMGGMGGPGSADNMPDWQKEIMDKNFFPLKVEVKKNGKTTSSQEITKVEPKALPASMFEPPAGYQKQALDFDIQKMMQQLQQEKND
jgi:hypothetical protein